MSITLHELTGAYAALREQAYNDNISPEAFADTLLSLKDEIQFKAENMAKLMNSLDADIEVIKAEEKRLADRRRSIENRKESIKRYLEEQLLFAGLDKVKTPLFTISIQNNPPKVEVLDENVIPEDYWVVARTVDKKRISEALKQNEEIPGVMLTQSMSLRIR